MDQRQEIDRAIEHEDWRVTRREQDRDYNQSESIEKWGKIIRFAMEWQNVSGGDSPSMYEIARGTGIDLPSVRYHCGMMMMRGLVRFNSGRIVIMSAAKTIAGPPAQPQGPSETTEEVRVSRGHRPIGTSTVERARAIARFIVDWRAKYGVSPQMKEIADGLGYHSRSAISGAIAKMHHLGWFDHEVGRTGDLTVTSLGMSVLLGDQPTVSTPQPEPQKQEEPSQPEPAPAPEPAASITVNPEALESLREMAARPGRIERRAPAQVTPYLDDVDDADLIIELNARGFRVTR